MKYINKLVFSVFVAILCSSYTTTLQAQDKSKQGYYTRMLKGFGTRALACAMGVHGLYDAFRALQDVNGSVVDVIPVQRGAYTKNELALRPFGDAFTRFLSYPLVRLGGALALLYSAYKIASYSNKILEETEEVSC